MTTSQFKRLLVGLPVYIHVYIFLYSEIKIFATMRSYCSSKCCSLIYFSNYNSLGTSSRLFYVEIIKSSKYITVYKYILIHRCSIVVCSFFLFNTMFCLVKIYSEYFRFIIITHFHWSD